MATEFKLPELGENVLSGNVVSVLVSEGQVLSVDEPVVEIETDKAVIEVPSSVSGTVEKIHVKQGDVARVGQVILTVSGGGGKSVPAVQAKPEPAPAEQVVAPVPQAAAPVPATVEPVTEAAPAMTPSPIEVVSAPEAMPLPTTSGPVNASPSVRRFARELGLDISHIAGTGDHGRVTMDDVKNFSRRINTSLRPITPMLQTAPTQLPDFSRWGAVEHQPMTNIRRITAERMQAAWSTIPHVTQFDKADITTLEALRKQYGKKVEAAGGKLTVTAILLKISASALKVFPNFNTSVDMAKREIIQKKYIHIGVAVDTDRGLLVPVIRDVDRKNIVELSVELTQLADRARRGKLTVDEMQGGCMTITNLGGIGGTNFTPIINAPEVAILAVSRSSIEPVYCGDGFEARTILPLALSYDHRMIDGADGARFLRWVAEALEQPFLLNLEG